jgi:4-hydroxy-2-oxoheptanedioate aldolase
MTQTQPSLRRRVLDGETVYGAFLNLASPLAAELCGRAGFDWLLVDLEHGTATESELLGLLTAIGGTPASALVRPASGERLRIGRALDLGARGIMVPRLERPEEVREVVSYLRWPPDGIRGLALLTRGSGFGEVPHADVRNLTESILGIIQVESPGVVTNADEIAAIDGVDVLFVGPTDLSHSLGVPGRFDDPVYVEALETVVRATRAAGKAAGILLRSRADLDRHLELGFTFVGIGSDGAYVMDGARAALGPRPA